MSNQYKVCIDAGHYGLYNRSPVVKEYYESVFNFKLQGYLVDELNKLGISTITTKATLEANPDLYQRGIASKDCNLFLSLHSNASSKESTNRISIYHLSPDDKETIDETSMAIAELLGKAIFSVMSFCSKYELCTRKSSNDRDKDGYLDDEYYGVLHSAKSAGCPAVLLEHGFHTNAETARFLLVEDNILAIAKAEASAIYSYFTGKHPEVEEKDDVPVVKPSVGAKNLYRVRKSWLEADTQLGAFSSLDNAISLAKGNSGYSVFDSSGVKVYSSNQLQKLFSVKVKTNGANLRLRDKPSVTDSTVLYSIGNGVIVDIFEQDGNWGKTSIIGISGWLSLAYTEKM